MKKVETNSSSSPPSANTRKRKEMESVSSSSLEIKQRKVEEKRIHPFVSTCCRKTKERISRAKNQRLFLIERKDKTELSEKFLVLGSTGNVYTVNICKEPNCSCPDFAGGYLCKHILFVYLKVLRVDPKSNLIYQNALLSSELRQIFEHAPAIMSTADERVVKTYKVFEKGENDDDEDKSDEKKRRPFDDETHCPICYECFNGAEQKSAKFCRVCGNNIHNECLNMWKSHNSKFPCPVCRAPQLGMVQNKATVRMNEGYVNLSDYQPGVSRRRDFVDFDTYIHGYEDEDDEDNEDEDEEEEDEDEDDF